MFNAIIYFFAFCLMLSGLFFIFYLIFAFLLRGEADKFLAVVEGYEDRDDLEKQIYGAFIQVNMMNFGEKRPVYVIDYNLSPKRKGELIKSTASYGKLIFITIGSCEAED